MFEDRTTENLKKETLAEIEPATGVSSMAGSYADATVGPPVSYTHLGRTSNGIERMPNRSPAKRVRFGEEEHRNE